jgi:hypothetical protein
VRRLAIVFLVVLTMLMGALGWLLGTPGVLQPDTRVLAAPRALEAPASASGAGGSAASPAMLFNATHGGERGD